MTRRKWTLLLLLKHWLIWGLPSTTLWYQAAKFLMTKLLSVTVPNRQHCTIPVPYSPSTTGVNCTCTVETLEDEVASVKNSAVASRQASNEQALVFARS